MNCPTGKPGTPAYAMSAEESLSNMATYAGITTIVFFLLLELKDKTKKKSHAAATTRLNTR